MENIMNKLIKLGCAAVMMLASCLFARGAERDAVLVERLEAPEMNQVEVLNDYYQGLAFDRDYMISHFVMENSKMFKPEDFAVIRGLLPELSDYELQVLNGTCFRDPTMMLVLSILVGELGVDRFLLGDTGLGVLKLITAGGLGIWWLVDIFTVDRRTKEYNFKQFNEALQNARLTLPVAR